LLQSVADLEEGRAGWELTALLTGFLGRKRKKREGEGKGRKGGTAS